MHNETTSSGGSGAATSRMTTIITDAATRYGVDPNDAIRIAQIESGMDPRAHNPSGASGLFQFMPSTWKQYGAGRSPFDAYANADAGMRFTRDNIQGLQKALGRKPTAGEIYMAHQQGLGGALTLLRNPDASAAKVLGRKRVLQNLPGDLRGQTDSITAGQFAQLWSSKIDGVKSPSLLSGGGASPSLSTDSSYAVGDANNPATSPVTYGEIDTNRFVNSTQEMLQKEEAQRQADANSPGFLEGVGLAISNNWSVAAPFKALGYQAPDPSFRVTPELLREQAADVPTEQLDEFADAVSQEHFEAIKTRILKQMETDQKLASMGATGVALQVGASLLDPGALAATAAIGAATGGLGLPAAVAARFGRAGTIALGAAEGVAGNLATDLPLMATNPMMDKADLMYSIGTGVVMGGAFSAFRKASPMLAAENRQMDEIGHRMQSEAVDLAAPQSSSVGAAQAGAQVPTYRSDDVDNHRLWKKVDKNFELVMGRARFDLAATMQKSGNPMVRSMASYLVEDAAGNAKGKVSVISASETQRRLQRVATFKWAKAYNDEWAKYRKRKGVGFWQAGDEQRKFSEQITAWQRAKGIEKEAFDPEVRAAGAQFNAVMKDWWSKAQGEGITRSEFGVDGYVPRVPHLERARELTHRFGYDRTGSDNKDGLSVLFTSAIKKAQPEIDDKLARKMGYAMLDRMNKLSAGQEIGMARGMAAEDMDDFRAFLKDTQLQDGGAMFSEQEIEDAMAILTKSRTKDAEAGGSARLKQRVIMDENHSMTIRDRFGVPQEVSIKDFYVNDANLLMHMYNRNMSGQIALARVKVPHPENPGEWLVDGIRNQSDFNRLVEQVKGVGNEEAKVNAESVHTTADVENLQFAYNAVAGIPNWNQSTDFARFLRMMRDYNFTRLMGQVGFSQIPEIGRVASQSGLKAFYAGMPSFRQVLKLAREGTLGDDLGHELDMIGAFGTDHVTSRFSPQMDDFGTPTHLSSSTKLSKLVDAVDPKLKELNHGITMVSGMAPINAVFQRWASRAFAVKFVQMAKFGDKVSMDRMKLLGLDEGDVEAIFGNIRKHAQFKDGVESPFKLQALGLDKWDGKASAAFETAMFRASRAMILENDVGQFQKWMSHPLGQTVLQFRSFAIGAYTRALMQGMNMRDVDAYMGFMSALFLGSLTYAGQTTVNLMGDPNADQKRKERLSWGNLALAGFQRTSESSILPIPIDMAVSLATGEAIFDFRSTGLKTDPTSIFGNPTADLITTAFQGVQGVTTAIAGNDYSKPDARKLFQALPGQRIIGAQWFFNWLASGLPQREDVNHW
jgi:hypothetical protein